MSIYQLYNYKKIKSKQALTQYMKSAMKGAYTLDVIIGELAELQLLDDDGLERNRNLVMDDSFGTIEKAKAKKEQLFKLLTKKPRSNAVFAHEIVVSASEEAFADSAFMHIQYFQDALKHIAELHGGIQYVVSAVVNYDKKVPFMSVIVMPIVNGSLNSREVIGGGHARMATLQSLFHSDVADKYGLSRGGRESQEFTDEVEQTRCEAESLERENHDLRVLIRDKQFQLIAIHLSVAQCQLLSIGDNPLKADQIKSDALKEIAEMFERQHPIN